jgi:hypothetical protein
MEDTVAAYAKALEMEKGKGEDGLGSLLSPTEMGIRQTATSDVPPDFEEIMSKVLPGQYVVGNGSTIYNNLQNGNAMLGMVTFRKAGHTWLIEVLTSWFDSLTGLPPIQ